MENKVRFDAAQGPRIVRPGDGLYVDLGGCGARNDVDLEWTRRLCAERGLTFPPLSSSADT